MHQCADENSLASLAAEANWSRERLDRDYNARATVGDLFEHEMRRYRISSEENRASYLSHADVVYDDRSGQTLDIFGSSSASELRPVFLFIHGGYWRALSKLDSSMMAGMLARQGVATAVIDYELSPKASLTEIVRQVRSALSYIWLHGREFGIDPDRIHIGGSSAGGHLVGMCLARGWHQDFGVPEDLIRSAMPISGLYDLAPIAAAFPQEWLALTPDEIENLSPIRHLPESGCPVVVARAEIEAPGFVRQSTSFAESWRKVGPVHEIVVRNRNHFDVLMELRNENTEMARSLRSLIR